MGSNPREQLFFVLDNLCNVKILYNFLAFNQKYYYTFSPRSDCWLNLLYFLLSAKWIFVVVFFLGGGECWVGLIESVNLFFPFWFLFDKYENDLI